MAAAVILESDEIDLPLGVDGDLDLDALAADELTTGSRAVAQGIRIALLAFRGEWFLDLDNGVPWLPINGVTEDQALLGQAYDEIKTRAAIREAILSVAGVASILKMELVFDSTRTLTITWEVSTTFGDTVADVLEI